MFGWFTLKEGTQFSSKYEKYNSPTTIAILILAEQSGNALHVSKPIAQNYSLLVLRCNRTVPPLTLTNSALDNPASIPSLHRPQSHTTFHHALRDAKARPISVARPAPLLLPAPSDPSRRHPRRSRRRVGGNHRAFRPRRCSRETGAARNHSDSLNFPPPQDADWVDNPASELLTDGVADIVDAYRPLYDVACDVCGGEAKVGGATPFLLFASVDGKD